MGKALFRLNFVVCFPSFAFCLARIRDNPKVIGMMASVLVNFTVTALFNVSLPRFHILSQVDAAAVTDEVSNDNFSLPAVSRHILGKAQHLYRKISVDL